ncbi:MAG: hypothetical protein ACK4NW_08995 [Roseinatronobacter sp.]
MTFLSHRILSFTRALGGLCVGALLFIAPPTPAQAQNIMFEGGAFLGEFSDTCEQFGWRGRPYFHVHYMPALVGGNENRTRLTLFLRDYAQSYVVEEGDFRPSFQRVRAGHTGWETSFFENPARVRVTEQVPRRIGPRTQRVLLRGDIRNFNDRRGCEVSFTVHVVRR